MNRRPHPLLISVVVLIAIFLIAPTILVIIMSFSSLSSLRFPPPDLSLQWYRNFFESPQWIDALWTSTQVALLATLTATVLGTLTALGLMRGRFPFKSAVTALILSPMIVPIVIVAVGTYLVFVDWRLQGTLLGFVVAHAALGIPLVVVNVAASLQTLDRNLEMAAQNLGAGPFRTFFKITLPLIMPGVIAGALFAFIESWDEVVVSIFLSSPFVRTLPVVMWSVVRSQIDPTIAALAGMLTALTIVLLAGALLARNLGKRGK
ncbi:MAG: ABC transporter permease [Thermoleophilia bacterium]|jgi:putative spermidine/putrescine transport system permease protein|nr:ABC transporter permease [Thermoleophilia bacterium]